MEMKTISKAESLVITSKITDAINAILEEHNLTQTRTSSRYGDGYKITIEADILMLDENGINTQSKEAKAYALFAHTYKLPQNILGKEFTAHGKTFKFAGIAINRNKFPFAAIDEKGDTVFFSESVKPKLIALGN